MAHWSLDSINWQEFDKDKATPHIISLVKAASMVEYNGYDYARYLNEVFFDDPEFQEVAENWAREEVQHGEALRKWAELADPEFDFEKSFEVFKTGYQLPRDVSASVRGSRCGELVARCIVEVGTSSYYTAIKEYTKEPVLQAICAKIAADEFRHYKLFYTHLKHYLEKENLSLWQRAKVVLGRIAESEDDELSYAFYAAHNQDKQVPYDHKSCMKRYLAYASVLYQRRHIERMVSMAFKVIGLKPYSLVNKLISVGAWNLMKLRLAWLNMGNPHALPVN